MEINTKTLNIPLIVHVAADVVAISSLAYVMTSTKKKLTAEINELKEANKQQSEIIARLQKDLLKLATNMSNIVNQLNHKVLTTPTEIQRVPTEVRVPIGTGTPTEVRVPRTPTEVRVPNGTKTNNQLKIEEILSSVPETESFEDGLEEEMADLRPLE
jgi:hypothetical protein